MAYYDAEDLRERTGIASSVSAEDIEDLIEEFEDICESYVGVAFQVRETTETVDLGCGTRRVFLRWSEIASIDEVTLDGDTITEGFELVDGWSVRLSSYRTGPLVVSYTHGRAEPPKKILRACREYVKACANSDKSRIPRDAYASDTEGITYRLSTPDPANGRPTGYIEVDRLLTQTRDDLGYRTAGIH